MNETRDLTQRYIAALWDTARSLGTDEAAHEVLAGLVEDVAEAEAQLAGLKLHLLHEARLSGADGVLARVKESVRTTTVQATSTLKLSVELGERFEVIGAALNEARISLAQAEAIVSGLRKLPTRLTGSEMVRCQETILEYTDTFGPTQLRILAARLLEVIDPEQAETEEAKRLAAEERAARRGRFLRLSPDFHGSMRITGQLPVADAAQLSAQLEALMPSISSYAETGEVPGPDVRRADALVLLCQAAANAGELPAHGGDRPTVHITMDFDTLVSGLGRVGMLGHDSVDGISAGEARRLACHAGIVPMVLDGESLSLDVGREKRLFTPAMIAALAERDKGCAFPNCHVPPASCHAHHIVPWWAWGPTCVSNGVLLCPHHHRVVEPDPTQSPESQWQVHLDEVTGLPWFTPPTHADPRRRPRQNARFILHHIKLEPAAGTPPCPPESRELILEDLLKHASPAWASSGGARESSFPT
ncbi:HNH endonuclease signature motif containing protein [Tessaracoccus massiliensis]|uniref:HNH endonuclease signature motif containing protein n=1 Tax=Tessaracoccus massiliensis TaxID=1522311 RepID=UPI00069380BC|nr:HNH endonuclease signature motif containing protein [Tessaracoccus massiliensis]